MPLNFPPTKEPKNRNNLHLYYYCLFFINTKCMNITHKIKYIAHIIFKLMKFLLLGILLESRGT